jgi:hypothetical protein
MSEGYIPIKRSLFEHFLFKEHRVFSRFEAWLDLIQMASFTDENNQIIGGKLIKRNRGEVVASLRFLEQKWGWSKTKVSDYLELLRSQQMVVATKENGVTKILLVNFEKHNEINGNANKKDSKSRNRTGLAGNEETEKSQPIGTTKGQRKDSEETNIIRVNNGNNGEGVGDGADAPTHTPEEEILFKNFKGWIEKNAAKVNKMKEPLNIDQYLKLRKDFPGENGKALLLEVIQSMHNHKELLKKYESANLTLRAWIKIREKNGSVKVGDVPVTTGPTAREIEEAENRKKLGIK